MSKAVFWKIIRLKQCNFQLLLKWFNDNHCIEKVTRSQRVTCNVIKDSIEDFYLWKRFQPFDDRSSVTDEYSVGDWKGHQPSMESSHCKAISCKREKTEKYKICEKCPFEILCPEEIKNLLQFHRRGKQYKKRKYQNWLIPIISFL